MQIKADLRKLLISRRNQISPIYRIEAGKKAAQQIISLKEFTQADSVLCYVSTASEMPTDEIFKYCFANAKKIATPVCIGENMIFRYINSFKDLEKGSFSIMEPKRSCAEAKVTPKTICVTPALCCNEKGFRIGYGRGFYDRFFAANRCIGAGLCYESFITDFCPDENDKAVDIIVTEYKLRRL